MRYYLDHETDKFVPVPVYVNVANGMMVQRFDGPREGEIPWEVQGEGDARLADQVSEASVL